MAKRLWIVGLLSVLAVAGGPGPDATAERARDELAHQHHLGITWPRSRALPRFASPRRLDVVDLTSAPSDQQLLLTTLQGVVNRTRPRIYLELGGDEGTLTWLNDLRVPYRVRTDPLELVARYRASYVEQVRPLGIMLNFDPAAPAETILLPGDLPQSTGPFVSTIAQGQQAIADASADWDGASPLFVSIGILAWSMTPSDIAAIADSLGPDYAIVRGDHYFQLVREAHGLSPQ